MRTNFLELLRRLPREAYLTLSGRRFAELHYAINTAPNRVEDQVMATLDLWLGRTATPGQTRLAYVCCLPPEKTGLANFAMGHLLHFGDAADIFSPVRGAGEFLANRERLEIASVGKLHVFALNGLQAMQLRNRYECLVLQLGNSDHCVDILRAVQGLLGDDNLRTFCYLHDPYCHNVAQGALGYGSREYFQYLGRLYDCQFDLTAMAALHGWAAHRVALDRGIFGLRVLVEMGFRRFFVNSEAARRIVLDDLGEKYRSGVEVTVLFHPVFSAPNDVRDSRANADELVIGTFGGPGGTKGTELIIRAVDILNLKGQNARLIVAGYGAKGFLDRFFKGSLPAWIEAHEPRDERQLKHTMLRADIAVQLRETNYGESSGVVSSLIGLGVPTVVSPIGSFKELGGAVVYLHVHSAVALADILTQLSDFSSARAAFGNVEISRQPRHRRFQPIAARVVP